MPQTKAYLLNQVDRVARPTIGLLMYNDTSGTATRQWLGVMDEARSRDVNLIYYAGNQPNNPSEDDAKANILYDLVNIHHLDGLLIWKGTIDWYVSYEEFTRFCQRYASLPRVSVESPMDGIPSVMMDNTRGMSLAIEHLIDVHGYRKIAFLRGPQNHAGLQLRYQGYIDTLGRAGIEPDPRRISDNCEDWDGEAGLNRLIDKHGLDFEAVACGSDSIAFGAVRALKARGCRVPEDVSVVGFDNLPQALVTSPPVTTIQPPFTELGHRAVALLLDQIEGIEVPMEVTSPCQLLIRRSCGCGLQAVSEVEVPNLPLPRKLWQISGVFDAIRTAPERVSFTQAAQERLGLTAQDGDRWWDQLWDAFHADLNGKSAGQFNPTLEQTMERLSGKVDDGFAWQNVLSDLQEKVLPGLGDDSKTWLHAETLLQQARVLVNDFSLRQRDQRRVAADHQTTALQSVSQALITTFDIHKLADVLAARLPELGIHSGYLALFDHQNQPEAGARMILAFNEHGRVTLPKDGLHFETLDLLPPGMLPEDERFSLTMRALYFQAEMIGYVLFGTGLRELATYEILRGQVSSALKGALLFEQRNQLLEQVALNAEDMNRAADLLSSSVVQTEQATHQVATSTAQVASAAQEQAASSAEMSLSVDRMAHTINQVMELAVDGSQTMSQATMAANSGATTIAESIESITSIKAKVDRSAEKINAMNQISTRVGTVLDAIGEIAYQTNLLALNAAMEAARAGEHGLGFEVVAQEVRKLANDSAISTQEVSHLVKDLQKATNEAVATMDDSTAQVAAGVSLAQQAEQALQQIIVAIDVVNQQVDKIANAMHELTTHAQALLPAIDQIAGSSQENSQAAQSMAVAAQQMRGQMQEMSESAESLRGLAQSLNHLMENINR